MTAVKMRLSKLDVSCLALAVVFASLIAINLPNALKGGPVNAFSSSFAYVTFFLFLQGLLVLAVVRKGTLTRLRTIFLWLVGGALLLSLAMVLVFEMGWSQIVVNIGMDIHSLLGAVATMLFLTVLFLFIAVLYIVAAVGGNWILARLLRFFLPIYLRDIRGIKYDGKDGFLKWLEAWWISFPSMLEPSSLRLDIQPLDARGARARFFQALQWQMAFGLLVAVYVSLNPFLLSSLSFSETYTLVSIPIGLIPMFILPWSVLEALGANVPGTRRSFYLHEGAKKRMVQLLLAMGTLLIIIRLAIEKIGVETLAWTFASLIFTLFILSAMVSFTYFNYFEAGLVRDIQFKTEGKGR